jgi:hypothetical protein
LAVVFFVVERFAVGFFVVERLGALAFLLMVLDARAGDDVFAVEPR